MVSDYYDSVIEISGPRPGPNLEIVGSVPLSYRGSRAARWLVAASDASHRMRRMADFRCDGTDDQVEINAALADLPATGGRVLLSEGTFTPGGPIEVPTAAALEGQGRSSVLRLGNGVGGPVLQIAVGATNIGLANFRIDGNKVNNALGTNGISLGNLVSGLLALNIVVEDCKVSGWEGGIFTDALFIGCEGNTSDGIGFLLNGLNTRLAYIGCKAVGNVAQGFAPDATTDISYASCLAKDNGSNGFDVWKTTRCRVENCLAIDNGGWGIEETGGAPGTGYNIITGNTVNGNIGGGINRAWANSIIRDNIGHITENSGTATITNPATSIVVAHGLDVTPTVDDISVTLAENPTADPGNIWVDTIGAANFTINCRVAPGVSNLDLAWRVAVL